MQDTWFEKDLRNWINHNNDIPVRQKVIMSINLAKARLKRNDGHNAEPSDVHGFSDLEAKLNKFTERKKLGYVICILENYLATGNFELPTPDQNYTEHQREENKYLTAILQEALLH